MASYHGHGLAIESLKIQEHRQVGRSDIAGVACRVCTADALAHSQGLHCLAHCCCTAGRSGPKDLQYVLPSSKPSLLLEDECDQLLPTKCCCCSDVQLLQEENKQLQAELQYLHKLLSLWQPQTCSICQLHSNSAHSSTKGTRSRASTAARDSASTYAAVDRILRQQQVLIAQQQRQLVVLQVGVPRGLLEVLQHRLSVACRRSSL